MKVFLDISTRFLAKVIFVSTVILLNESLLIAQSFRVFAVSDLAQVFDDGYNMPATFDTIRIFGIRGEILSAQIVLEVQKSITNVSVEFSPFKDQKNNKTIPASNIEWNFVGTIPLSKNSPNQPVKALVRKAPARFPEYLMTERSINLKEKTFQPVWITFYIPQMADEGTYMGKVNVKSIQGDQSLPFFVRVYPLNLPSERHLKVVEWYNTEKFATLHGIKEEYSIPWFEMLSKYAENMVAHRQNVFRVPMDVIEISISKTNELDFDFTRFDQIAQVFWNTGRMDWLETGFLTKFGVGDWFSTEILLENFLVKKSDSNEKIKMRGEEVIPLLLPSFENHLRRMGWLKKTFFHIKDEPSVHNALAWKSISSYLHQYAPELKRMDAIETTFLLDDIEIAVPKLDALASWYGSYKAWQGKGNELWFYTVGIYQASQLPNKTIDMPVIDNRLLHWLNYRYNITGYLHWGWNQWTDNPFVDTDIHVGDGWHVYPAKDGVLNSIRWEQMRNGLQDYEYFWMLEKKIQGLKDSLSLRFSWIEPKQRGMEIACEVITDFYTHTDDPQVLYKAKMKLIKELLEFEKSPKIYVQTNPVVNSTFSDGSSVEVSGWTEPGTKIIINGKEVPVSNEGLFLEQFGLSNRDNSIKVMASDSKNSKEIVRTFNIK